MKTEKKIYDAPQAWTEEFVVEAGIAATGEEGEASGNMEYDNSSLDW